MNIDFKLVATEDLTLELFRNHGIWAQYNNPDDIDSLELLGYDREAVESMIKSVNWSDDFWFPIPGSVKPCIFQFEMRFAHFITPGGIRLNGAVYNRGHAIYLFGKSRGWGINKLLPEMHKHNRSKLMKDIGISSKEEILPLKVRIECDGKSFEFGF